MIETFAVELPDSGSGPISLSCRACGPRDAPRLVLLHGFPELAFSWRNVMLPLAKAGYHVIAPDQRGYGRSGGTDVKFDDDLTPFSTLNRVRDMMALINALGHRHVSLVVGHDFGSPTAGWCAWLRSRSRHYPWPSPPMAPSPRPPRLALLPSRAR